MGTSESYKAEPDLLAQAVLMSAPVHAYDIPGIQNHLCLRGAVLWSNSSEKTKEGDSPNSRGRNTTCDQCFAYSPSPQTHQNKAHLRARSQARVTQTDTPAVVRR